MRLCPRLTLLCPASPPQVPSPPLASSPLRFLSALAFSSPPLAARQKAEAALEEEKRLRGQVSSRYGELLRACFENNQGQYLSDHAVTIQRAYRTYATVATLPALRTPPEAPDCDDCDGRLTQPRESNESGAGSTHVMGNMASWELSQPSSLSTVAGQGPLRHSLARPFASTLVRTGVRHARASHLS